MCYKCLFFHFSKKKRYEKRLTMSRKSVEGGYYF